MQIKSAANRTVSVDFSCFLSRVRRFVPMRPDMGKVLPLELDLVEKKSLQVKAVMSYQAV